jgi:replicative DNA helicase
MNSHIIIGSILNNPKCLGVISDCIRPEMLDIKEARTTLQAMIMMDIAGEPIDLATVKTRTPETPAQFLIKCLDAVATSENAEYYAKQQYEYWAKKKLAIMHSGVNFDGTLNETLGKMAQIITDFERDFTDKPKVSPNAGDIVNDYLKHVELVKTGKTKTLKCHTPGLHKIINEDQSPIPFFIGGLYIVISSYSSAGKSAYLANIAANEAEHGANIVIFSNEMGRFGYTERFAGYYSNIPYGHILYNKLNGHQDYAIDNALLQFSQQPIKIFDRVRGVSEIKSTLKKLSYSQKTDIVIVDYLQNLIDKGENQKAQLDTASKGLMQLAQDMDLTVIAASQIDNASAKGQNENKNFMSIKGSGDVAADADIVIELSRDALNSDDEKQRTISFCVKKNRPFGRVGSSTIYFNKSFTKLVYDLTNE